jgi:hypothetical protein
LPISGFISGGGPWLSSLPNRLWVQVTIDGLVVDGGNVYANKGRSHQALVPHLVWPFIAAGTRVVGPQPKNDGNIITDRMTGLKQQYWNCL